MGIPIRTRVEKKRKARSAVHSTGNLDGRTEDSHVQILVSDQHGKELLFRLRRQSPLCKLFSIYALRVKVSNLTFFYNGKLLDGNETPDELKMKSNDYVQAHDV
mmetsp:Transcript_5442/g.12308  ORF Transcript_5442/g.12308 Transcript_5442/m.12308 type:complete len:104 (+) Transcript_5442:319-630(+)|eukprot:CAMPEP_0113878800 /NCGR_PEP_ID=MMETSP0780_2-20120614/6885_1 /TAXON_ID=652834 /ORGANISM="Palpitomonas bilix" /LENGTH=103 /DNA_ID=CAMNT_0000865313 /DNA_START=324 /DNA_END=635 /DNA_ORIENTATION=+ /assembly_acc=CAM_ASM_000599